VPSVLTLIIEKNTLTQALVTQVYLFWKKNTKTDFNGSVSKMIESAAKILIGFYMK
jgi:hypothetical protein